MNVDLLLIGRIKIGFNPKMRCIKNLINHIRKTHLNESVK